MQKLCSTLNRVLKPFIKGAWFAVGVAMSGVIFASPVEIEFWHSHAGLHGREVSFMAKAFNKSQDKYKVRPIYKGDYNECLTSLAAAFRAKQAPPLVQIFEVGTETMLRPEGITKPVEALFKEHHLTLEKDHFFPAVKNYFSENDLLVAMPFNTSVPVLFYNEEELKKAGYTKDNFPKTWQELEKAAHKLKEMGHECVLTTSNPAWILIESTSAIHGLPVINEAHTQATYNNKKMVRFISRIKAWQDKGYFEYGGRTDDSSILFTSGRCPMYTQSSGSYNSLKEMVSFPVGVSTIPLDTDLSTTRHTNISGGGALWVMSGHSPEKYDGVVQFIHFLSSPDVQSRWHQNTGYLPIGISGQYQALSQDSSHPSLAMAKSEFSGINAKLLPKVSRVHNQIRVINEESLEAVFAGLKSPKQALDEAVARSNHALMRFTENTKE